MATAVYDEVIPVVQIPRSRNARSLWVSRAMLWPALAVSIALTQIPFLATIFYSFQSWNLLQDPSPVFAGFQNYVTVFTNGSFLSSFLATALITSCTVAGSLLLGLGFAILLDRKFLGRGLARTLMITPFLVMPAAAALIWKWSILDASTGFANWALGIVGIAPVAWGTDAPVASIVMVLTWQYTPFFMLILLAGLQSQSKEVLEASSVDGAGPVRRFALITLPHMRSYIEIAVLLGSIQLVQAFDPIAIMTRGSGGTKTLSYLLYERAFVGLNVGEAAAYGVITVLITIVIASLGLRLLFSIFTEGTNR
ncbi:carbohydrate ABC transporter permease [Paenarthrobacter sp. NPDC091669]|uniref:carbohydrate ABC transporter permease n=1 Tax=Paenarthrobacter sp. NPDC091669 TaxID=3364384 RepID=UPI0037F94E29